MKNPFFTVKIATAGMLLATLLLPATSMAATHSYAQDTFITSAGVNLVIKDGSQADAFALTDDGFTVTVPSGEQFEVRTRDSRNEFQNDAGISTCDITRQLENRLFIAGPQTVVVRPSAYACSTTGYAEDRTASFIFSNPTAGETVMAGQNYQFYWSTTGSDYASLRLRLSVDGGLTYPTLIAENLINNGYYAWNVPTMTSTNQARIKVEAVNQSNVVAFSASPAFSISGTAPEPTDDGTSAPATYSAYDAEAATAAAMSIDDDGSYVEASMPASGSVGCTPGLRIKGASSSAVYYCGRDLKRHAFPNQHIHDSWFQDFNGIATLSDATLAQIQLGQNVTYRPGVRMIKIQTDPKVYVVSSGAVLRWVPDQATAEVIYGAEWNKMIDDVSDAFFFNYTVGEPLPLYVP